jgi:secretion/DNA translocation related TadE-like protein
VTGRGRIPADERGSATVWVLALAALLGVLGAAVVLVGTAVVARHRASAAADLAALAAAGRAVVGDAGACAAAAWIARADGATLESCAVGADAVAEVHVRVPVRLGPFGLAGARARARAGPVAAAGEVPTGVAATESERPAASGRRPAGTAARAAARAGTSASSGTTG